MGQIIFTIRRMLSIFITAIYWSVLVAQVTGIPINEDILIRCIHISQSIVGIVFIKKTGSTNA